ncbi:hypothetical protein C8J57DRAFT_1056212 [Mycena rebaudengoi]|nr:hypothetical protein C8J57DRAFT_1056212 [Mycena rebaudengoi]
MLSSTFIKKLKAGLSPKCGIFTSPDSTEFKDLLLRWSDIDLKVPGIIAQVASEQDAIATVKIAAENNVSFVPKSGGHSY